MGLKLLFWGNSTFFRTLRLVLISAKPYYQNARINRGIIFGVRQNLANDNKLPVRSGIFGVSLISVFSSYFINLSGTLCGRPPPRAPRRRRRWPSRFGRPHPPGPHGGGGRRWPSRFGRPQAPRRAARRGRDFRQVSTPDMVEV